MLPHSNPTAPATFFSLALPFLSLFFVFLSLSKFSFAPGTLQLTYRAAVILPISELLSLFLECRRDAEKLLLSGKPQEMCFSVPPKGNIFQVFVQGGEIDS